MKKNLPNLTMVLGGAASGKSFFAENMIYDSGLSRTYIATSQAWDDEMRTKIEQHKIQRGTDWTTLEVPIALPQSLQSSPVGDAILIDCATLWLTNLMLGENDISVATDKLLTALQSHPSPVVIVTNEVGAGIVPQAKMGRDFRNIQGRFNQRLAADADLVVQVTAGLPHVLKGQLP